MPTVCGHIVFKQGLALYGWWPTVGFYWFLKNAASTSKGKGTALSFWGFQSDINRIVFATTAQEQIVITRHMNTSCRELNSAREQGGDRVLE